MTDPADVLAEPAASPARVEDVPPEDLPDLLAALEGLRARLLLRLRSPAAGNGARPDPPEEDRLLDAEEVADLMGVGVDYVYDHANGWPFARRISPRKLRFSRNGLHRWLETRPR